MSGDEWRIGGSSWKRGDSGPLHTAVLFVDLVHSTDLASVMGLEEYASFSRSFRSTCLEQSHYFFEDRRKGKYATDGRHYAVETTGDEFVVLLHTDRPHDDLYQLVRLALALKCAWLGVPLNAERVASGRPTHELAAGIHSGPVWATRTESGFDHTGFAINLAKRVESRSRDCDRFRILVSDPAFKLVNRRIRNLLFGPRRVLELKGVSSAVGVYEVVESFVDTSRCLHPDLAKRFLEVALRALGTNTFDLWIHSCVQVAAAAGDTPVSDDALRLCQQVLNIDPNNAVALFYASEAHQERNDLETARLYLEDLVRHWPRLGDGWLALGRLQEQAGRLDEARRCILQARRHGVGEDEYPLPSAR